MRPADAPTDLTDVNWRKSTRCDGRTACVEVGAWPATAGPTQRPAQDGVLVRDSTDPTGPVLSFSRSEFRRFAAGIKAKA